jgi:hypothetical protein
LLYTHAEKCRRTYLGSLFRELWEHANRRGATSDDGHLLPRIIIIFRPELRVKLITLEIFQARDFFPTRRGSVVVIVSRPKDDESGRDFGYGVVVGDGHSPIPCCRRPAQAEDLVSKIDVLVYSVCSNGIFYILFDFRAFADEIGIAPWVP